MKHEAYHFWLMTVSAFILLGALFVCAIQRDNLKKQAIQRGYAEYNSTNGQWQWKEQAK